MTNLTMTDAPEILPLERSYHFETVNHPDAQSTVINDINNGGDFVGVFLDEDGVMHGYAFIDGEYLTIDHPTAESTFVQTLDDDGRIYGDYLAADGTYHGFKYIDDTFTEMAIDGSSSSVFIGGADLSGSGYICGMIDSEQDGRVAYIWDGEQAEIFAFPGADETYAFGMNEQGDVVGAYLTEEVGLVHKTNIKRRASGEFQILPEPADAQVTMAYDINNDGTIVSQWFPAEPDEEAGYNPNAPRGLLIVDNQMFEFQYPGSTVTGLLGINDDDVVVGFYDDADGIRRGFIATPE